MGAENDLPLNVVVDTQIFQMQRSGGGSVYWAELLRRMDSDEEVSLTLLKSRIEYDNMFWESLDLSNSEIVAERFSSYTVSRVTSPIVPSALDTPSTIFHASYLRMPSRSRTTNILTIHDFTHQRYFSWRRRIPNSLLKKRAIGRSHGIVVISESTRRDLDDFGRDLTLPPVVRIYNGVGEQYFPIQNDRRIGVPGIDFSKAFILYVGARDGYKNFDFALEVLSGLPSEISMVVVGTQEAVHRALADSDRIKYTGTISSAQLNELYNSATCLIYTSKYEGFGIPVAEAVRAGCPVIVHRNSSIPEILQSGVGLMNDYNAAEWISAIAELRNPGCRREFSLGQREGSPQFTWDATYHEVKEFYKEILSERLS